jgi:hypothetical protein
MEKIEKILEKNKKKIEKIKNVNGYAIGTKVKNGVDTKKPCITVFVEKKEKLEEIPENQLIPQSLDEIETDVVEIGRIEAQDGVKYPTNNIGCMAEELLEYRDKQRPLYLGCSIGNKLITAGSTGALTYHPKNKYFYLLSNIHVFAENCFQVPQKSYDIIQPGAYDLGKEVIGTLKKFKKLDVDNNYFDAALAQIDDEKNITPQTLAGIYYNEICEDVYTDVIYEKEGRTTGLTEGTLKFKNATVNVNYGDKQARFLGQYIFTRMSAGGDSGSIIRCKEFKKPVALLFAGSNTHTIASPIKPILDFFEVEIVTKELWEKIKNGDYENPEEPKEDYNNFLKIEIKLKFKNKEYTKTFKINIKNIINEIKELLK